MIYDLFNGDADGICALHQLRLSQPLDTVLITGLKRDINLLSKIDPQSGDQLTVLDISLDRNRIELIDALNKGVRVDYFDHHHTGEIPQSENLNVHIDTSSEICTSLIVNKYLQGIYSSWAIVGAYGDNLYRAAEREAKIHNFNNNELQQLKELGTALNYNGYGIELNDLHYHPKDLFLTVSKYNNPFEFINEEEKYQNLFYGYKNDLELASAIKPSLIKGCVIVHLPNTKWARRVSGVYGNQLARENPNRAHALFTETQGGYRVSVRAPLVFKQNADTLCLQFDSGGGRAGAAGINYLDQLDYDDFVNKFLEMYNNQRVAK